MAPNINIGRGVIATAFFAVCLGLVGTETFAQTVHARTSYDKSDIIWGARFRDMYLGDEDHVAIDLDRLHDFDRIGVAPSTV